MRELGAFGISVVPMSPTAIIAIVGVTLSLLVQFGGVVWWAATATADRKAQRSTNDSVAKSIEQLTANDAQTAQILARHDEALRIMHDRPRLPRRQVSR